MQNILKMVMQRITQNQLKFGTNIQTAESRVNNLTWLSFFLTLPVFQTQLLERSLISIKDGP
jgi:hypothetical protein